MKIKKLTFLEENLNGPGLTSRGLSPNEISALEVEFCAAGKHFQTTLKEFLFLTGDICAHFNSGTGTSPNFNSIQQKRLSIIAGLSYTFNYPNIWSFGYQTDSDYFYFVDLNQEVDDPDVYFAGLNNKRYETGAAGEYIEKTEYTFSAFVEASINYYLEHGEVFPH